MGFLKNLFHVFPTLTTRPLYLIGESYAGMYVVSMYFWPGLWNTEHCTPQPYITKHHFSFSEPPLNLRRIVLGNRIAGFSATSFPKDRLPPEGKSPSNL